MNPPRVVYIGTADYSVRHAAKTDFLGETFNNEAEILLRTNQAASVKRETLMHEALHAILFASGFTAMGGLGYRDEEALVSFLSPWILSLLRDNPKLVDFLMENREKEF